MPRNKFFHLSVAFLCIFRGISCQRSNDVNHNSEDHDHNSVLGKFMLGHPTGVAIHPASVMAKQNDATTNVTDQKVDDKVTDILHGLLQKYDNRLRPNFHENHLLVTLSFSGFRIVDVEEGISEISSVLVLQQKWMDTRLNFDTDEEEKAIGVKYITVNHDHTRELWLPDTYFMNEEDSEMHNDAVVLFPDGTLVRSMRHSLTTHCRFNYESFPFDTQKCEVVIGSVSNMQGSQDILYIWDEEFMLQSYWNVVDQAEISKISQFMVTALELNISSSKPSPVMSFKVTLQRSWRPYISRFYLPMVLFVFVSIGCLFINEPRFSLILNLINLALLNIFTALHLSSTETPQVRSTTSTSLDCYFLMCMMFLLLSTVISIFKISKFKMGKVIKRRRNNVMMDLDEQTSVSNGGNGEQTELERIYRSPSYSLRVDNRSRSKIWCMKLVECVGSCLRWYKWEILGLFLFCDFVYFRIHSGGGGSGTEYT